MRQETKIWLALDERGKIQGAWWRGCMQPLGKWRGAVKHFGWRAICTCGTCPPPPTGGKRPTERCAFYGGKPCAPNEACECEIWDEKE